MNAHCKFSSCFKIFVTNLAHHHLCFRYSSMLHFIFICSRGLPVYAIVCDLFYLITSNVFLRLEFAIAQIISSVFLLVMTTSLNELKEVNAITFLHGMENAGFVGAWPFTHADCLQLLSKDKSRTFFLSVIT